MSLNLGQDAGSDAGPGDGNLYRRFLEGSGDLEPARHVYGADFNAEI